MNWRLFKNALYKSRYYVILSCSDQDENEEGINKNIIKIEQKLAYFFAALLLPYNAKE